MKHLLNLFIVLNALKLVRLFSTDNNDKSYTDYESKNDLTNDKVNDLRSARIFWPYPMNKSDLLVDQGKVPESSDSGYQDKRNGTIKSRFLGYWTYPHNPIIDLMMHTAPVNYAPADNNDPFDFLRDSYPTPKDFSSGSPEEHDYVIVGGGTAGAVLAARLAAEQPRAAVLVLEAGRPEMILSDVPAMAQYLQETDYVWPYTMEHQPGVCMGSVEQRCYAPRGRALGGHSVTNSMVYARGRPHDWDSIAADGNYGWSYNEVLPYFMKSERTELKKYKNATYHGRDGEITVENVPFKTGLVEAFLAAGREFGHPTIDYNCPDQLGFGYVQTMSTKGHRMSTAKAFLHPNKRRKNLHILTEATVTKIIIEPQSKRAYAVEYIRNNEKHTARFRREVILSAGPIASAQLLLLSGIGPGESLGNLGIPVISDVKVGRSLYDHISFPGVVFKLNSTNASLLEPKVATLSNMMQWLQFGDGLLTTPGGIEGVGYLKTVLSKQVESVPDIELLSMGGSLTYDSGGAIRKSWRISDKTYQHAFGLLSGLDTWQAIPVLLHPKSKGYLELRDTNPFSHPKLFGNYLSDPEDLATLKEAVKYIIKLGESEPFRKYGAKLHLAPYPTCSVHPLGSEAYWECAIKTMTVSLRRQVGTCKMGPPTDHEAVVDPELRVYGVDGIRVADSSVVPRTISSDTTAAEIMIAEKAADMIKKTWANVVA